MSFVLLLLLHGVATAPISKSQHTQIESGIVNVVKTTNTVDERFIFTLSVYLRFKMVESQSLVAHACFDRDRDVCESCVVYI